MNFKKRSISPPYHTRRDTHISGQPPAPPSCLLPPPPLVLVPPPPAPPLGVVPGVAPPLGVAPPPPVGTLPPRPKVYDIPPPIPKMHPQNVSGTQQLVKITPEPFSKASKIATPKIISAQPSTVKVGSGLRMNLGKVVPTSKSKLAQVFNPDSSDEEEEMPEEARIRMRNVGRDTITSSGPNSFGKTSKGFTDTGRLFERNLWDAMDKVSNDNLDRKKKQ